MKFPGTRQYIESRRAELEQELLYLKAATTNRSSVLSPSVAATTDRAVAEADTFTDGTITRQELEDRVREILQGSTASGLNDPSPAGQDRLKLFVNEALVYMGLLIKSQAPATCRGLLARVALTASTQAQAAYSLASVAVSRLQELEGQPIGQGVLLAPDDSRSDDLHRNLAQALEGSQRLEANAQAQATITETLSMSVQGFLRAALEATQKGTADLDYVSDLGLSMVSAVAQAASAGTVAAKAVANVLQFRASYESTFRGSSSDTAQASALRKSISDLYDTVTQARTSTTNLAPYRKKWAMELAVLLALARESRPTAPVSVFSTDVTLSADYTALSTSLSAIPVTDVSSLEAQADSLRGFLVGTSKNPGFQEQYDLLYRSLLDQLTVYRDRLALTVSALQASPFLTTLSTVEA
jgi:hypothetical protein